MIKGGEKNKKQNLSFKSSDWVWIFQLFTFFLLKTIAV